MDARLAGQIGPLAGRCPVPGEHDHDGLVGEDRLGQQRRRTDIGLVDEAGPRTPEHGHEVTRGRGRVVSQERRPPQPVARGFGIDVRAGAAVDEEHVGDAADLLQAPVAVGGAYRLRHLVAGPEEFAVEEPQERPRRGGARVGEQGVAGDSGKVLSVEDPYRRSIGAGKVEIAAFRRVLDECVAARVVAGHDKTACVGREGGVAVVPRVRVGRRRQGDVRRRRQCLHVEAAGPRRGDHDPAAGKGGRGHALDDPGRDLGGEGGPVVGALEHDRSAEPYERRQVAAVLQHDCHICASGRENLGDAREDVRVTVPCVGAQGGRRDASARARREPADHRGRAVRRQGGQHGGPVGKDCAGAGSAGGGSHAEQGQLGLRLADREAPDRGRRAGSGHDTGGRQAHRQHHRRQDGPVREGGNSTGSPGPGGERQGLAVCWELTSDRERRHELGTTVTLDSPPAVVVAVPAGRGRAAVHGTRGISTAASIASQKSASRASWACTQSRWSQTSPARLSPA